jgi:hypothetical protein
VPKNPYNTCWDLQNGSNPSGIVLSLSENMAEMRRELEWLYSRGVSINLDYHPAYIWWLSKLTELSGLHIGNDALLHLAYVPWSQIAMGTIVYESDEHVAAMREYETHVARHKAGLLS